MRTTGIAAPITEREAPDFLLQLPSGPVGVEVTQIHHPTPDVRRSPQARESAISRVVALAQALHQQRGGPSLRVSVGFVPNFDPQHLRRDTTAAAIVALVEQLLTQPGEVLEWRPDYQTYKQYPEQIAFVHIYRQPPDWRPHWLAPQAGWVGPLPLEHLQAQIDEKALLLPKYRLATPVVWLLFANEGRTPSQFFDRGLPFHPSDVRSTFDRTFLSHLSGRFQNKVSWLLIGSSSKFSSASITK